MEMRSSADGMGTKAKQVTAVSLIREHDKAVTFPNLPLQADRSWKIKKHMHMCVSVTSFPLAFVCKRELEIAK